MTSDVTLPDAVLWNVQLLQASQRGYPARLHGVGEWQYLLKEDRVNSDMAFHLVVSCSDEYGTSHDDRYSNQQDLEVLKSIDCYRGQLQRGDILRIETVNDLGNMVAEAFDIPDTSSNADQCSA